MIISWKVIPISAVYSLVHKKKMEIGGFEIENSTCEKPIGVYFDNRLTFDYDVSGPCKKPVKN